MKSVNEQTGDAMEIIASRCNYCCIIIAITIIVSRCSRRSGRRLRPRRLKRKGNEMSVVYE